MNRTVEDKLIDSINNIKSTIGEKDQLLWKSQAKAKCYAEATEDIKSKISSLREQISKTDAASKDLETVIRTFQEAYSTQLTMSRLIFQSILIYRSHKKLLEEKLRDREANVDRIRKEYQQQFQKIKEQLEKKNPMYQMVQEKRCELKKCQIRCKMLESKIIQQRNNFKGKRDVFYNSYVSLAKRWIAQRDYLRMEKEVAELKKEEVEWMKKVTQSQENIKKRQELANTRRDAVLYDPMNLQKLLRENTQSVQKPRVNSLSVNKTENVMQGLQNLIEESSKDVKYLKSTTVPKTVSKAPVISADDRNNGNDTVMNELEYLMKQSEQNPTIQKAIKPCEPISTRMKFNADSSKVKILENKVLLAPSVAPKQPISNKEERSRLIEDKLHKVVRKMERKRSKKSFYFQDKESKNVSRASSQHSIHNMEAEPMSQANDNQNMDDMNIISQEESDIKFVSQQSQGAGQDRAARFDKIGPAGQAIVYSNPTIEKLPMTFQSDVHSDGVFRKPSVGNPFGMNLRGPSNMSDMKASSNMASILPTSAFKRNAKDDLPMSMGSNIAQDKIHPGILSQNDEKNMAGMISSQGANDDMNFGDTQYDFGNMSRDGQIGDYSADYDMSFMKSPTETMTTNFQMPFGNFGSSDVTQKPFSFSFMK